MSSSQTLKMSSISIKDKNGKTYNLNEIKELIENKKIKKTTKLYKDYIIKIKELEEEPHTEIVEEEETEIVEEEPQTVEEEPQDEFKFIKDEIIKKVDNTQIIKTIEELENNEDYKKALETVNKFNTAIKEKKAEIKKAVNPSKTEIIEFCIIQEKIAVDKNNFKNAYDWKNWKEKAEKMKGQTAYGEREKMSVKDRANKQSKKGLKPCPLCDINCMRKTKFKMLGHLGIHENEADNVVNTCKAIYKYYKYKTYKDCPQNIKDEIMNKVNNIEFLK